jgi:tRNA G18 (ribose-2'-O)-methylase SpoU
VALLLGAEGPGLRAETLASCRTLRIPMRAGWDSLNVGVASGIALFWLGLARPDPV